MSIATITTGLKSLTTADRHAGQEHATASNVSDQIQAYLSRKVWSLDVKIPTSLLPEDVAAQKKPTGDWYALHYITEGDDKWNHDVMAWGLNISISDLSTIRETVAHLFSAQHTIPSHDSGPLVPDIVTVGSLGVAHIFDEAIETIETLYSAMKPRLSSVRVPRFWRESAVSALALSCCTTARCETASMHRAKTEDYLPTPNCEPPCDNILSPASLNFDCVDRIFSMSGLKLGTMRALARVWGFSGAETENLIKRRCSPIALLGELVAQPEELRNMMHDCDVILVGSRAVSFFWPSKSLANSDWNFITHPHVSHWLKFAAYLVSIGVEFEMPANIDDPCTTNVSDDSALDQEHHSEVKVLRGTLWHKGRRQRVQLAAHLEHPRQQSSIQEVLRLHSSIDQCFVTGFGAVCMYAQQTTNGQSHVWSVGDCHDDGPRVKAQRQIDRNISRGIEYIESRSHAKLEPGRIPEPKLRSLGDPGALIIPFEQYVSDEKTETVRADFDRLREISWWEECHGLKAVRQAGGSFWSLSLEDDWVERAVSRGTQSTTVPLFDSIMERLRCPSCQINTETLCREHMFSKAEKFSARLLFICLRHVERRRMSWSFLGLDIDWDDCWEYPYV
jgi:hypothetical protein